MPLITRSIAALLLSGLLSVLAADSDEERARRQAELDRACEEAREKKLAPLREKHIQECVEEKQFDTRGECETYYADFGARSGRAPMFHDLPPCVEAFEYQMSERAPDDAAG